MEYAIPHSEPGAACSLPGCTHWRARASLLAFETALTSHTCAFQAAYNHNRFYDAVGPMLGLLMALSLVYPLSQLIRCGRWHGGPICAVPQEVKTQTVQHPGVELQGPCRGKGDWCTGPHAVPEPAVLGAGSCMGCDLRGYPGNRLRCHHTRVLHLIPALHRADAAAGAPSLCVMSIPSQMRTAVVLQGELARPSSIM